MGLSQLELDPTPNAVIPAEAGIHPEVGERAAAVTAKHQDGLRPSPQ